jgi:selenocysteine-specific elongation factor
VLTRGDRFILRAYSPSVTIGGGVVLDPHPPRAGIRTVAGRARFRSLDPPDATTTAIDAAVSVFLAEKGSVGLTTGEIVRRAGLSASGAEEAAERAVLSGQATRAGGVIVSSSLLTELSRRVLDLLEAHHAAEPLSEGLPREEARERIFGKGSPDAFEHVLVRLSEAGVVTGRDRLALARHQLRLSVEESAARERLDRLFKDAALEPPDIERAAGATGVEPALADRMVKLLLRQKVLAKVDALVFHAEALDRLKREVRALAEGGRPPATVDVAAFKARYGISRKYAIPLLEYLDRERVTRRMGDKRVVLG